jgi:hypothetical protein
MGQQGMSQAQETNIHIHVGAFMGTPGEARKLAEMIEEQRATIQILKGAIA